VAVDTPDGTGFNDLLGQSITYRVALGPHQGRKAFTLKSLSTSTGAPRPCTAVSFLAGPEGTGLTAAPALRTDARLA
jgi:hypothetical protein